MFERNDEKLNEVDVFQIDDPPFQLLFVDFIRKDKAIHCMKGYFLVFDGFLQQEVGILHFGEHSKEGIRVGNFLNSIQFRHIFVFLDRLRRQHEGFRVSFAYFVFEGQTENEEHLHVVEFRSDSCNVGRREQGLVVLLDEGVIGSIETVGEDLDKIVGKHLDNIKL